MTLGRPKDAVEVHPAETPGENVGFARDLWPRALKIAAAAAPTDVHRPTSTREAAELVASLASSGARVRVFGAGSNVVGSLSVQSDVVISTAGLDGVLGLDEVSQTVTVGAGMLGQTLETWLNARGFTLGHYPQSLAISTVGGWLNTRATGTYSAHYGGVERLVCGLTAVLADGTVASVRPRVRAPGGLDLIQLVCGSEGSFCLVTEVSLSVSRILSEKRICAAFSTFAEGLECQRELMQAGYAPALLRLYSAHETEEVADHGTTAPGECLLIMTMLGNDRIMTALEGAHREVIISTGGRLLPESAGAGWYERRYRALGLMEESNAEPGVAFDTIEISVPWRTADACAEALEGALAPMCAKFYHHASHAYRGGVCIYVMLFLEAADDGAVVELIDECWAVASAIVETFDGTIGHHHGIGSARRRKYVASAEGQIHQRIKSSLDPHGLFVTACVGATNDVE